MARGRGTPYGGPYRGPDAVAEHVFGPLIEDTPDSEATLQELIASGERGTAM